MEVIPRDPRTKSPIKVRGMPERDISSLGAMGLGEKVAGKYFRRRRRPPQKWLFGDYRFPSFSDT